MEENNLRKENLLKILEYCTYAIVIGAIVGFIGTELGKVITKAVELRTNNPWLIWCLPVAGVVIALLYQLPKTNVEFGATKIIKSVIQDDDGIPFIVAPLIFVATALTHLCGGSAGREGAALLLGASLADTIARLLKLKYTDMRVISMCGMAAGFTALFGTPVAATIFALEIIANKISKLDVFL